MAYYGYEFYYNGTRATFWGYMQVALINMGWELHDDISATVKVYRSNGESGNEPYGYVWFDAGTSTYIQICAYQYWDNSTHSGVRPRYTANTSSQCRITAFSATAPALMAGDKDLVLMYSYYTGAANSLMFGHVSDRIGLVCSAHGTAGTAGTLTVASTAGIGVGQRLQMIGDDGYAENLYVSEIVDSSTILVNNLSRNYGTGSKIGAPASTFGLTNGPTYHGSWYPVSAWGDTGTAGTSTLSYSTYGVVLQYFLTLLFNEVKYVPSRGFIANIAATAPGAVYGSISDKFLMTTVTTENDVIVANNDGSLSTAGTGSFGTAASGGNATLIDSSKSWGADEMVGKFCVITGGSGTAAGGVKKITGNDSTSLTMDSNWYIKPVSGSIYILADLVARGKPYIFNAACAMQLTDTLAPT